MTGDEDGMLKLLVSPEDRCVLGVHAIGSGATDLVHIGQAVMANGGGGLDFLVTAVFNYPTFAESYKVAALDAANRIKALS
jgi:NAD(P) transhydrogenase